MSKMTTNNNYIFHKSKYTFKAYNPHRKSMMVVPSSLPLPHQQQGEKGVQVQDPLRLLVIGDSLARGVGQAHHCNPVLPQAMAKYLSQNLNSRPIYWTTVAEPGASTKWMRDLVEVGYNKTKQKEKRKRAESSDNEGDVRLNGSFDDSSHNNGPMYSLKQFRERHSSMSGSTEYRKKMWIENLEYHEELYTQNPFQYYDIIIVMAGLNDIKRMLVPFLLEDEVVDGDTPSAEGSHDHKDNNKKKRERGFPADMRGLIELLNMEQSHDYLNSSSDQDEDEDLEKKLCSTDESTETECSSLISRQQQEPQHRYQTQPPMIVFPRFPTTSNPVKMGFFLKMIAVKSTGLLDSVKGRIADEYDNVISPEAPSSEQGMEYLLEHALKTHGSAEAKDNASGLVDDEEVMVNLINMSADDCKKMEDDMSQFYSQRNAMDFCVNSPLLKLFAPDGLHASDFGYDHFGHLLAKEIMKKWGHDRLSQ